MTKESSLMSREDGIKLKIIRNNMGLSAAEFSKRAEINPGFLNLLEKGCLPLSLRDKRKISEAFGLQENWFEVIDTEGYLQSIALNTGEKCINRSESEEAGKQEQPEDIIKNGDSLKLIRTAAGLSRKEIAAAIGVTSVQIGYIETGKRTLTDRVKNKLNEYFAANPLVPKNLLKKVDESLNKVFGDVNANTNNTDYSMSDDEVLDKIRIIKNAKGYTQTIISEKTGVNRSQVSMIENGKMQMSKNAKMKLIDFIVSESESANHSLENTAPEVPMIQKPSPDVSAPKQNKAEECSEDPLLTKYELIKIIESMKKTRDELIVNINKIEKALKSI